MPPLTIPAELLQVGDRTHSRGLLVAVDGGATKTVAALWSAPDAAITLGHAGPSNPDAVGSEAAAAAIRSAADAAGLGTRTADVVLLGIAGTDNRQLAAGLGELADQTFVVNDVVTAWAAGTAGRPGVAVIAGTGSHVLGVGTTGSSWRCGGWGHVLGDEGSAYWIGLEALKCCLRAYDRAGPDTSLAEAAPPAFSSADLDDLVALVYRKPLTKGEIAAFAEQVSEHAEAGDAVSREILARAGDDLGSQAVTVLRQVDLGDAPLLAQIGSTWKSAEPFHTAFRARVAEVAPNARYVREERPPLEGGLLLAGRAAGLWQDLPDTVREGLADAPR